MAGLLLLSVLVVASGCSSSRPYTLGPVKTEDPDRQPIAEPREIEQNFYWDRVDLTLFHQVKKPLNLSWTARRLGSWVGASNRYGPAENVNALDEPPRSSWWEPRDYYTPMSPAELAVGPNVDERVDAGPDTTGTWTVWRGKSVGAASGFFIQDAEGIRYLLKFDQAAYPELASSAEVISTKILHAAGYHVPQNTITHFHPDQIEIGEDATIQDGNGRRLMRPEDVISVIEGQPRRADGKIRVMASRFVDGHVLGPWNFRGRRDDDPNDRVRHENRRELRGLRVIGAWLNDTDRRAANTLAVYTDSQYVKHYVQDMSSTLGANTGSPHQPIHGQAYMIDHRKIAAALVSFGGYPFPWWEYDPAAQYPSVGYWRADVFRPGEWVPTYPNPAFERMTPRDAFWGAKLVSAFSDEDLRAIVETAKMSNPEAEAYLLDILAQRRDKAVRYWFSRLSPLDRFRVTSRAGTEVVTASGSNHEAGASGPSAEPKTFLAFDDLLRPYGSFDRVRYRYEIRHPASGERVATGATDAQAVPLRRARSYMARRFEGRNVKGRETVLEVRVTAAYSDEGRDRLKDRPPVRVYIAIPENGTIAGPPLGPFNRQAAGPDVIRVVGIDR